MDARKNIVLSQVGLFAGASGKPFALFVDLSSNVNRDCDSNSKASAYGSASPNSWQLMLSRHECAAADGLLTAQLGVLCCDGGQCVVKPRCV